MSIELLTSIDPAVMRTSAFSGDFMAAPAVGVPSFLPGVQAGDDYWRSIIEGSRASRGAVDLKELSDSLVAFNRRLGAGRRVLDRLARASSGEVFFVVTGQQPGILGGALMVAYKVVTAVVLARFLERRFSIECVPLYWCGSDDADFQEIRNFECVTPAFAPVSVSIPANAHAGAQPVGNIEASWTATTWRSVAPVLEAYPFYSYVDELVNGAAAPAADHGEAAAALMLSLFGGEIAVVDGRADVLKRSARNLYLDYFDREDAVLSIVRDRGTALHDAGYHAQLEPGSDSGIFLLEEGARRKVPAESRQILADALTNRIERCTPGVILRTLIQDRLFRPLAAVLGPAEIAYRAQIHELYGLFGIPAPAPVPRLSATWMPPEVAAELTQVSLTWEGFLESPRSLADSLSSGIMPRELHDGVRALSERVSGNVGEYLSHVEQFLPGGIFKKYQAKVTDGERRLQRALEQIDEAGRQAASDRWPWMRHLESLVSPRGGLQERTLSLLLPFLIAGEGAREDLELLASTFIDDLLDGKPAHYVYSLRS